MERDKLVKFSRLVSFTVPYKRHGLNKLFGLKLLALNPTRGMFVSTDACLVFFLKKSAVCVLDVPLNKVCLKLFTERITSSSKGRIYKKKIAFIYYKLCVSEFIKYD